MVAEVTFVFTGRRRYAALTVMTYVNTVAALITSRMAFDAYGKTDMAALGFFAALVPPRPARFSRPLIFALLLGVCQFGGAEANSATLVIE